jgi:23S rRNA pseudouridine2457 synthase
VPDPRFLFAQLNPMLLLFNKPYGVLSSFTGDAPGKKTLSEFGFPPRVYPVGRLDADSEGLLLLCDEAGFNHRLLDPGRGHWRRYWAQVEGEAKQEQVDRLTKGVLVQNRMTLPARAGIIQPTVPPRDPPIRERKSIPTSWIELELREGRNRQVRRMTAAVDLPTLRLLRVAIGDCSLPPELLPGRWKEASPEERKKIFAGAA